MTAIDDFLAGFREGKTDLEKEEDFEVSTLKLVLAQLGAPKPAINGWAKQFGPAFTFDWFNSRGIIPARVASRRVFRFEFKDLLFRPTKSEVVDVFKDELEHGDSDDAKLCMIFKVFEYGRMVATTMELPTQTHLHVYTRGVTLNVAPFGGFFSDRYGPLMAQE